MDYHRNPDSADLDFLAFCFVLLAELLDRGAIDLDVFDLLLAEAAEESDPARRKFGSPGGSEGERGEPTAGADPSRDEWPHPWVRRSA